MTNSSAPTFFRILAKTPDGLKLEMQNPDPEKQWVVCPGYLQEKDFLDSMEPVAEYPNVYRLKESEQQRLDRHLRQMRWVLNHKNYSRILALTCYIQQVRPLSREEIWSVGSFAKDFQAAFPEVTLVEMVKILKSLKVAFESNLGEL